MKFYFCKPFHSWEKGKVENIKGLIIRWFPKGTNFYFVSDEEKQKVGDWIDNREFEVLNRLTKFITKCCRLNQNSGKSNIFNYYYLCYTIVCNIV